MKIRAYEESDLEALRAIHARQGFGYAFPDLGNPLFLTKLVLGREEGGKGIAGAALLRLTAEAYLLLDPEAGTPREKWQLLLGTHGTWSAGADAELDGQSVEPDECAESAIAGTAAVGGKPGGAAVSKHSEQ